MLKIKKHIVRYSKNDNKPEIFEVLFTTEQTSDNNFYTNIVYWDKVFNYDEIYFPLKEEGYVNYDFQETLDMIKRIKEWEDFIYQDPILFEEIEYHNPNQMSVYKKYNKDSGIIETHLEWRPYLVKPTLNGISDVLVYSPVNMLNQEDE